MGVVKETSGTIRSETFLFYKKKKKQRKRKEKEKKRKEKMCNKTLYIENKANT